MNTKKSNKMVIFYSLLIAAGILLISGCTPTYWLHRTKTPPMGQLDLNECKTLHTERQCSQYGPSSQTSCLRNALTGGVDCSTNSSPGGTTCKENVNDQQVQRCMNQKGWRKADKDGKFLD